MKRMYRPISFKPATLQVIDQAKDTDSRFRGYVELYGDESWELDALEPRTLIDLIKSEIKPLVDTEKWEARREITARGQATLRSVRDHYDKVIEYLVDEGLMEEPEAEDGAE